MGESTDDLSHRFDELLQDNFVSASALLNPFKTCRVLKRTDKALTAIQNLIEKYAHHIPPVVPIEGAAKIDSQATISENVDLFSTELVGNLN